MNQNKILLFDTNGEAEDKIKAILQSAGFEVCSVSSSKEAVKYSIENKPDLLIIDMSSEGNNDGIAAVNEIKKTIVIPFIYTTEQADTFLIKRARETNPSFIITKPVEEGELIASVKYSLNKNFIPDKENKYEEKYKKNIKYLQDRISDQKTDINTNVFYLPNAIEMAKIGPWEYDVLNDEFTFNDYFYKVFRTDAAKENGFKMTSSRYAKRFVYPEDIMLVYNEIRNAIETKDADYFRKLEHRILYADGKIGYILMQFRIVKDEKGKTIKTLGVIQDITERKLAEKKLFENEERYRRLIEAVPDSIFVLDYETDRFIDANLSAAKMYGYNYDELTKMRITDISAEPEMTRKTINNKIKHVPFRWHRKKNGTVFPVEISISYYEYQGRIEYVLIVRDISERLLAEQLIKNSEKNYRELFENSLIGIYQTSPDGKILMANKALCNMLGFSSFEELHLRDLEHFGFSDSHPRQNFKEQIEKNGFVIGFESEWKKSDGSHINIRENARAFFDSKGQVQYYEGTVEDITDWKEAQEQIKTSLREKEVLLKEIHHRVKNNLQIISSLLGMQSDYIEDIASKSLFVDSLNRIKSMALIHERLYQSKDLSNIDFGEYVNDLTSYLASTYKTNTSDIELKVDIIKLNLSIEQSIPIGLIINELVSNSFKYAFDERNSGKIEVILKKVSNSKYYLILSDDGKGIPDNINFKDTKTLGLQIVNNLVEQINGKIILDNSKGTNFIIEFNLFEE